ncbi:GAF domain-containing protein [Sphingomonas sp. RS6]
MQAGAVEASITAGGISSSVGDSADVILDRIAAQVREAVAPDRIVTDAIAALGHAVGAAKVAFGNVDRDADAIDVTHEWTRPGIAASPGRHTLADRAALIAELRRGRTMALSDIEPLSRETARTAGNEPRAAIVVPLGTGEQVVALLAVADDRPRPWSAAEIDLADRVATRLWSVIAPCRLTEQLRESEAQFRLLAENMPGMCWLWDGREVRWANRAWHALFDGTDAWRGDVAAHVHPDDLPLTTAIWAAMRRGQETAETVLRIRGEDGLWRPFLTRVAAVRDAGGTVLRWCGVQIDLTEKLALDQRHTVLRAFHDRTRDLTDPNAILTIVAELMATHFGIRRFLYCDTADGDAESLNVFHSAGGSRGIDPCHEASVRTAFRAAAARQTWQLSRVVDDNQAPAHPSDDPVTAAARALGVRAGIIVPIVKNDRLFAAMAALHDSPRQWSAEEIALCEELAERLWATISRARAEDELRERERNQTLLIAWSDRTRGQASAEAIIEETLRCLGEHLDVSRVTYAESDPAGRVFTVRAEWRNGVASNLGNSIALGSYGPAVDQEWLSGSLIAYEDVALDPRATAAARDRYRSTQIAAFVSVPLLREGVARSVISVQAQHPRRWRAGEKQLLRDIAERAWITIERARAQAALLERDRNQQFLIDWSDRLRSETTPERVIAVTLESLAAHLGVTRVTHAETDGSGECFTVKAEWRDPRVCSILGNRFRIDSVGSEVTREWVSGRLVRYDAVASDARLSADARERYGATDIQAFVSIPLVKDGRTRSALSIQHHRPREWRDGEIQLLQDVAERVWATLERARAQAALQERERIQAFLIEWTDRLRSETSPDVILAETLGRLGRHLGVDRTNFARIDPAGERLEILREWRRGGPPADRESARLGISDGVHAAHLAGEIVLVENVEDDPRFDAAARAHYLAVEAGAFLAIPLAGSDRVRAVLSVQQRAARRWHPAEVQLLQDVAERMWDIVERARAEAALQDRERIQAFLVQWTDRIRGERRPREMLAHTLEALGRHLHVRGAGFAELDGMSGTHPLAASWCGVAGTPSDAAPVLSLLQTHRAAAAQGSGVFRIDDIASDPRLSPHERRLLAERGTSALLSVPMTPDRDRVTLLWVEDAAPRGWHDADVELIGEVAERILALLDRARSEERLAESEAQLSAFLENAPLLMHIQDDQGRYLRVNPEFGRAVGVTVDRLVGAHPDGIFAPAIASQLIEIEARARGGQVASAELDLGLGDRYGTVLSIMFPIQGGSGTARTAGFAIDLTERKRAEAALARSREALYQSEKLTALGSLLAGVSHELNNPLSIVVAQAVMMERQARGTELADRAQKISKAADRCARIVQTFLAMARQRRPERTSVDLNEIVIAAHELTDYSLRTEGIVTRRMLVDALPRIAADSDQLHQVIINLIVNAQHAMADRPGERILTLRTAPGAEAGTVMLEVSDTGPGIPEDLRRRIFEPFFTTKPQGEGTGVGLSFSQGLAEAHGGRLELIPSRRGARFRLTLPIDPQIPVGAPPTARTTAPPPPRRALVIDDEPEIAESLADFLSIEGFECRVALGGAAAREMLGDEDYDLIVSDLRMPDVDGPQLHAWIRAERPHLLARMGFSTGDTLGAAAERFLSQVDRPVLEKPFVPDAVHRFLKEMDLT